MGIYALFLLGIGLSFDTFAVSVSCGLSQKNINFIRSSRIAIIFAFFQAFMPIIGWLLGLGIKEYLSQVDHWIAFALLLLVGLKMIYESLKNNEDRNFNPEDIKVILFMSFATTIDAFAIGITLAFLNVKLFLAAFIIGAVTYVASMLGILFGKSIGAWFGKKMEIIGGLILISLGVKILIEHLSK